MLLRGLCVPTRTDGGEFQAARRMLPRDRSCEQRLGGEAAFDLVDRRAKATSPIGPPWPDKLRTRTLG